MTEKETPTAAHVDRGDTQIRGVLNAALADATYRQKPKLLTRRMFKVGARFGFVLVPN